MSVKDATGALATAAKRSADAAARSAKAKQGEKNEEAPRKQEETKPAEQPAAEQAKAGAEDAQPPKADEPPRAHPRPKAALSSAKEGAEKAERRDEGKPIAKAIDEHIASEEEKGNDQADRRERVENAKHQGDLQIELALEDAADGKTEDRGYEDEDAARAREDRGLSPIEHADATQRAMIAEQLAEESARFKDAQEEQLQGRLDEEKRNENDQAVVDFSGMTAEERAVLYQNVANEQALLKREADVLDGGTSGEATDLEAVDVDDDGEGGDIEGLDNEDREARSAEIDGEIARLEDLDEQIAATFTDEELDGLAGTQLQVDSADGSSVAWEVDEDLLERMRSQRDRVAEERPDLVPSAPVADQPIPPGAFGAEEPAVDPTVDAGAPQDAPAPAPLTDEQLLDGAASVGIIDPAARGQFAFNESGELTYAAQPADGYWHAAEHVAPPVGQDFDTHWRNIWGENSMRNHGVPNEDFVATGQAIVIPGYHRDDFVRFFTPQTPAVDESADDTQTEEVPFTYTPAPEAVTEEQQQAVAGPSPELVAQDQDQDNFVDIDGREVYISGADVVSDDTGAAMVYSNGVPLANVTADGSVTLAEGATDAHVQALYSQQLLIDDADLNGVYEFAYRSGEEGVPIQDPVHVERLNQLLTYYAENAEDTEAEDPDAAE